MLQVSGISKTFREGGRDEVRSLCNIHLSVEDGEWVVVIGTNGSGKSTLLNSIAGSFDVDKGEIQIAGKNVTHWPEYRRAKLIGRVFQNPFAGTAPSMSVAENLALAVKRGLHRGLEWAVTKSLRSNLKERVRSLHMGLEDRLEDPIGALSGGQRQALTLVMATWRKPELLLLDEHTAALDPKSAEKVIALTEQIVTRDKITTLMVTHSMPQAATLGDRLIMMHKGTVIHDISGNEKRRLTVEDLLMRFEQVRRSDLLDPSAAEVLRRNYV